MIEKMLRMATPQRRNKRVINAVEEENKAFQSWLTTADQYDMLCAGSYTRISDNPDVKIAVSKIANLVSSMTIHLMKNTDQGDKRVINGLSRKIDVDPYSLGTKKSWLHLIVENMLIEGNSFVYPTFKDNLLHDLVPLKPSKSILKGDEFGYNLKYGNVVMNHDEFIHFKINVDPEEPFRGRPFDVQLKEVVEGLKQAGHTKKNFMSDKWKPSVIISVDALTNDLASEEGRNEILNKYITETSGGRPWIVPADFIKVDQVKPLSLKDLALNEAVELDKRTVASIFGIPPFMLGVGKFDVDEYNTFISNTILPIAKEIEQELTRKLIWSTDMYFKFNVKSLFAYNIKDLSTMGGELYSKGIMTGNEVRDMVHLSPKDDLDELIMLENYIPASEIGNQAKLKGGEEDAK